MIMRKATPEDIPLIREMAEVVFRRTYKEILSPAQMEYMMDMMYSEENLASQMASGHYFFLEEGKGYASFRYDCISEDGKEVYHLEKLYVMPHFQGSGLGRAFFDRIVSAIRELTSAPVRIELNVNRQNTAVTFYEHLGMTKARTGDFAIGKGFYMNDYIMSIDI